MTDMLEKKFLVKIIIKKYKKMSKNNANRKNLSKEFLFQKKKLLKSLKKIHLKYH